MDAVSDTELVNLCCHAKVVTIAAKANSIIFLYLTFHKDKILSQVFVHPIKVIFQ